MLPRSTAKTSPSRLQRARRAASLSSSPRSSHESHREEYLSSLHVPSPVEFEAIAKIQESREAELHQRYHDEAHRARHAKMDLSTAEEQERAQAAGKIQRVYRGHRTRRAMNGLSLDPSSRWDEVLRDARYRYMTTPRARRDTLDNGESANEERPGSRDDARSRWQQVGTVARHAHGVSTDKFSSSSEDEESNPVPKTVRAFHKRQEQSEKAAWTGKMMDLPYFLEMVDLKHRYGSNLRAYHAEWKKADTHENFFYWLDHGEGKNIELSSCPRGQLEREQVRYLSREERMQYMIKVDSKGKLRWCKNDELIDTTEEYRDSVEGIVPLSSPNKTFRQDELEAMRNGKAPPRDDSDSESSDSEAERRYPDPPSGKGPKKVINVSPATIMNRLMRKSVKKNTWIFVADLNMNIYVGIKQSGSFQHSSFIQGSRVSAAGLIKVKNGQLRSLAPLSGHYRPPTAAFKHFLDHLKASGADLSRMSVSKSYAVLLGLETYLGGKKRLEKAGTQVAHGVQHIVKPSHAKARKEQEKDTSQSAQLEEAALREEKAATALGRVKLAARDTISHDDSGSNASLPDRTRVQPV